MFKMYFSKVYIICLIFTKILAQKYHGPSLPQRRFLPIWNSPSFCCESKWNISLNLNDYGIVDNAMEGFHGQYMNIFYVKLGLWPYYDDEGLPVNGGLPQQGDIDSHLDKVAKDITTVIPDEDYRGMAVIDWEKWRPVYDRNWDKLSIYRQQSELLVQQKHPSWTKKQIETEARKEFEYSAEQYMKGTILVARKTRPEALWGYYGFPRCYNTKASSYKCSAKTMEQNNQISWLFESSSVILPSIYLSTKLKYNTTNFAKGNILEAFRMANVSHHMPIFPYVRIVYALSEIFLNKEDMYSTVTQSAELATSGVIIWGSSSDCKKDFCIQLKYYIAEFFGPLVQTLSSIAQDCSDMYCNSHGTCRFQLAHVMKYDKATLMSLKEKWTYSECICDDGWKGESCEEPVKGFLSF